MNISIAQRPDNGMLLALRDADFDLIKPYLIRETKQAADVLYEPGDDIGRVYFPLGPGLISYAVDNIEGHSVQAVLVGSEGAVGGIVSAGGLPAYCLISVKSSGAFLASDVGRIQAAKDQSDSFRRLFERYADCLMSQMFQATACNAVHSIEQRCAKWILEEAGRTQSAVVHLSHDDLASMLGAGRSYVTRVLQKLAKEGIVRTARGAVTIIDKRALTKRSCGCKTNVEHHFQHVLGGIYPE